MMAVQEGAQARLLHIVDGDHAARASIAMAFNRNGGHAEIYEDVAELILAKPTSGAILIKEPAEGASSLPGQLHAGEVFLPVIVFAESPTPSQVVRAVHSGVSDFLSWPFSDEDLVASCDYCILQASTVAADLQRKQKAQNLIERLSHREKQTLAFMIDGYSNKSMGLKLNLSPRTVEDYRLNCLQKLGVASSSAAIRIGLEAGLHLNALNA